MFRVAPDAPLQSVVKPLRAVISPVTFRTLTSPSAEAGNTRAPLNRVSAKMRGIGGGYDLGLDLS